MHSPSGKEFLPSVVIVVYVRVIRIARDVTRYTFRFFYRQYLKAIGCLTNYNQLFVFATCSNRSNSLVVIQYAPFVTVNILRNTPLQQNLVAID